MPLVYLFIVFFLLHFFPLWRNAPLLHFKNERKASTHSLLRFFCLIVMGEFKKGMEGYQRHQRILANVDMHVSDLIDCCRKEEKRIGQFFFRMSPLCSVLYKLQLIWIGDLSSITQY